MDPLLEQLHAEERERLTHASSHREVAVEVAASVSLLLTCVALWLVSPPVMSAVDWQAVIALMVAYVACWQVSFSFGLAATTPLQLAFVPMWFAVEPALLPLLVVAAQLLGSALTSLRGNGDHWHRIPISIGDAWYAVGPAIVFLVADPGPPSTADWPIYVLALGAQFLVDGVSGVLRNWAVVGVRPKSQLALAIWMWGVDAALAPVGLLVALSLASSSWAVVLALPLVWLFGQFAKERDDRIRKALELSSAYRGTAELMGDVLEADDAYTGGEHTQGVVAMALAVGEALRLDAAQQRDLEFGALLHDIGKLRVPNEIINKPGKLTDEEWAIIKLHPGYGQEMLDRVGGALADVGVIVRAHHERWDGGGYPDGLVGAAIPVEARIITVCDSFSAMTTDRSYRRGMSHEEALAELERCSGTQFDPQIVAALRGVLPSVVPAQPSVVEAIVAHPLPAAPVAVSKAA